jgi:hypothetical protein
VRKQVATRKSIVIHAGLIGRFLGDFVSVEMNLIRNT